MADILNNQYKSVFSSPKTEKIVEDPRNFFKDDKNYSDDDPAKILNIDVKVNDIEEAIDSLKSSLKSTESLELDGFLTLVLKKSKKELSQPLSLILKEFLKSSEIPSILKIALPSATQIPE